MSDFDSSLPVRTQTNGDVAVKVVDGTVVSQALAVDASGKITAKLDDAAGNGITSQVNGSQQALDVGIDVAGVQIDPRQIRALTSADVVTANQGAPNTAANGWPVKPTDGTNSQSFTAAGEAKVDITQPLPAGTNLIGSVKAQLQDNAGTAITLGQKVMASSVPVVIASDQSAIPVFFGNPGTNVTDYKDASAIAAGASDNHDYTVTAGKVLTLSQIESSASGKAKMQVQVETGVATGVFNTKYVQFNSTATPNMSIKVNDEILVAAGVRVRVIMTNRDLLAEDLYSTVIGHEV